MNADIRDIDVLKTWCLSKTLNFTRYFFKHRFQRKFVVGDHHEQIADILDRVLSGELKKVIINIAPRYGKAIDCETPMLTTLGWKKANEIKEGDFIFGRNGNPTKVIGVYPQGITNAYNVVFSDNSNLVTCSNHLWSLNHKDLSRKSKFQFKELRKTHELIDNLKANDGHKLWSIPICEKLNIKENDLPIDPYLFGCWLGDGSSYKAEITTMDESIIKGFEKYGVTVRTHQNAGKATTYGIRRNLITDLKKLGVVGNKHIPIEYLLSSKDQRLELLKGLCDTDGTCNRKNGQVSYCSTSQLLINDVKTLICSLGGTYTEYRSSLFFRLNDCPFKLERKQQYWKPLNNKHFTKRFIDSIEKVEDRETVCFTVDSEDRLFLAGKDLIVTHNTELAVKAFIAEGLAINPKSKFIHLSYSDDLARDNSMGVQEIMNQPEYKRLFEAEAISHGTKKWYTKEGGGLYAVSSAGQVTGFGAGLVDEETNEEGLDSETLDEFTSEAEDSETFGGAIVIDDPIKPDDAQSSTIRDKVNSKFDTTIRNRVNSRNTPIIIIMQRLHENDLCGYLIAKEPGEWTVLSLPCIYNNEEGEETALWPFKHTLEELKKEQETNKFVFETQYMQNPKPLQGLMYEKEFKTYVNIPYSSVSIKKAYIDTADTGKDFLCAIAYLETETANYITDVYYTQQAMETTEPATAEMLTKNAVKEAVIEANNGGRGFSRNVEAQCRIMKNNYTSFTTFHQGENKAVRIFTHSAAVQNVTYFPEGWDKLWPKFYRDVTNYMKVGKNDHDDAVDTLTGTYEQRGNGKGQDLTGFF